MLKKRLIRIIVGAVIYAAAILIDIFAGINHWIVFGIFLVSFLVIGGDVIWKALRNIARGRIFDENFLMLIATVGAFVLQDYREGVAVMLFYQVGELFQSYAVNRSRKSISELMDIAPEFANVMRGGKLETVDPEEVEMGETIVVKPGEKIPLDGVVLEGTSFLDTSALTGESVPREVQPESSVLSGCINNTGVLTIEVTKEFEDSTVAKILDLVENASSRKANAENFITKFARYYTPVVVIAAVLLAVIPPLFLGINSLDVWSEWVRRALTFLVISCPCALVISIPLGFFGGIGGASKWGVLVKGSNYLEALAKAEVVVFDKTGTLTKAKPTVVDVVSFCDETPDELLRIAACLEEHFPHSMAKAVVEAAKQKSLEHEEMHSKVDYVVAHGISSYIDNRKAVIGSYHFVFEDEGVEMTQEIKDLISSLESKGSSSLIYLAIAKKLAGIISIYDPLKPEAKEVVQELRDIGFDKVIMLTGDSPNCAKAIAKQLNLDDFRAGVLPEDKASYIESLKKEGNTVVMVGDGINDTPALSMADVSISLQDSSDIARELADITLVSNSLNDIVALRMISEGLFKRIHSQYRLIVGLNTSFIVLGALGLLTPQMLAMLHNGSTFLIASGSTRSLLH